jgi:uncharacterized protein
MSGALWVPVAIFGAAIIGHFAVVDWAKVDGTLLLAVVCAAVLVGFAEETLFRGIILRSLRTTLRPEAWVMLVSSLWFGFFHLTNLVVDPRSVRSPSRSPPPAWRESSCTCSAARGACWWWA